MHTPDTEAKPVTPTLQATSAAQPQEAAPQAPIALSLEDLKAIAGGPQIANDRAP